MNQLLRTLAVVLFVWLVVCAGCDESGETTADVLTPGVGDVAGEDQATQPTCAEPTAGNPLLGCLELGECTPTACDSGGATWEDMHTELKTFWQTQPTCTELPAELHCRNKSVEYGDDWPDQMEAAIQSAAQKSGGFVEEQIQALRCLGAMEPSNALGVAPGEADARVPSSISLGLEMPAPGDGVSIHDDFLEKLGPMVGTILHVTDDHEFEQKRKEPGDDVELRLNLVAYKGIPVDPDRKIGIDVDLHRVAWPGAGGGGEVCPGRWIFASLTTDLSRYIETLETDPTKLIPSEDAVTAALAACGEYCSYPVMVWDDVESGPDLFITTEHVLWRVTVDCPVPECDDEPWVCTHKVDAETGDVLSGGLECCIDCPGMGY